MRPTRSRGLLALESLPGGTPGGPVLTRDHVTDLPAGASDHVIAGAFASLDRRHPPWPQCEDGHHNAGIHRIAANPRLVRYGERPRTQAPEAGQEDKAHHATDHAYLLQMHAHVEVSADGNIRLSNMPVPHDIPARIGRRLQCFWWGP